MLNVFTIEKKMVPNLQVCGVKLPPPSPRKKRSNNGKIKLTIATNGSQKVKANIQWQPKVTATDRITKQNRTHHLKKSLLTPAQWKLMVAATGTKQTTKHHNKQQNRHVN